MCHRGGFPRFNLPQKGNKVKTMDNQVSINSVNFTLTAQQPTGNVRSGLIGGSPARVVTAHMEVSPKGKAPVLRTTRKVEVDTTVQVNGVAVVVPVSATLTVVRPSVAPVSALDAPYSTLVAWQAVEGFLDDIKTDAI